MINHSTWNKVNLTFLFLFLTASLCYGQTIHAIVFAATNDATIGDGSQKSFNLISSEIETIINQTGMRSKLYYRTSEAFTLGSYQSVINELEDADLSKDMVLFYFLGHGYQSDNPYPNLVFKNTSGVVTEQDLSEASVNLEAISKEITAKGARLTIVIGEACNNELDLGSGNYANNEDVVTPLTPPLATAEKYRRLFLDAEGSILVSSSRSGQPSYISKSEGGAFTQSFLKALHKQTQKSNTEKAHWIELLDDAREQTQNLAKRKKLETIQTPQFNVVQNVRYMKSVEPELEGEKPSVTFWTRLVAYFAPNKVEKSFNKALKEGDLLDLESILATQGESGDKMKQEMITKNPVTFYMAQAMIFEEKGDTVNSLLNYSIAYELGKSNRTKRDQALIDKIIKLNEKHGEIAGLNEAANYQTWLKSKLEQHRTHYENDISQVDDNIVKIKNEIEEIEVTIEQDRSSIKQFQDGIKADRQRIQEIEQEIKSIDIKRTQTVEIKLGSVKKESASTLNKIDGLLEQIEREGIVDNQKAVTIDDAKVEFKFAKRNTASSLEPTTTGYQLGKYCTTDIVNTTTKLMDILLKPVDKVPNKEELQVKVKVIGNADWQGGGKLLNIWYTGEQDIFQEYVNGKGESKTFKINRGESRRITNEELAFLRAYCSYEIIKNALEAKGVRDYMVHFQAIEHIKPEKTGGNSDPGSAYRGVNIDMTIENLFKHYLDKIKQLEQEIEEIKNGFDEIERRINRLKTDITEKENSIEQKRIKIEQEEARKAELEKILNNASTADGVSSRAKKEVERVLKLQQQQQ
jgi:phage shock protein A